MKYMSVELDANLLYKKAELMGALESCDCTVFEATNLLETRYGASMICRSNSISNCLLAPVCEGILMLPFEYWEGIEIVQANKARLMDANECQILLEAVKNNKDTVISSIIDLAEEFGILKETQITKKELTYMGRTLDTKCLLHKDDLLERLKEDGGTYKGLSDILDRYDEAFGADLKWHYPISDGVHSGGFLVPVCEGMLYIPYNEVYAADEYEMLLPDEAVLMDEESTEVFITDLTSFVDGMCNAMREAIAIYKNQTPSK